jgi:hypothetical protein
MANRPHPDPSIIQWLLENPHRGTMPIEMEHPARFTRVELVRNNEKLNRYG